MGACVCVCECLCVSTFICIALNDIRSLARFTVCSWLRLDFISTLWQFSCACVCVEHEFVLCICTAIACVHTHERLSLAYTTFIPLLCALYSRHGICIKYFSLFSTVCLFFETVNDFVIIEIIVWSHLSFTARSIYLHYHHHHYSKDAMSGIQISSIIFESNGDKWSLNFFPTNCTRTILLTVLIGLCSCLMCLFNFINIGQWFAGQIFFPTSSCSTVCIVALLKLHYING